MKLSFRQKTIFFPIIALVLTAGIFFLGWLGGSNQVKEGVEGEINERHENGFRFISPLLECQTPASYNNNLSKLEDILNRDIEAALSRGEASHVSIYLRDLNNGPWIGINAKEKFSPASLMKVPLLISYLKLAESDPAVLDRRLAARADSGQVLPQNITPAEELTIGQEYPVSELLERMIIFSDNTAAVTLLHNIDEESLVATYENFGIEPLNGSENVITVRDYASFFRILYNASYLNREMSEKALSILSRSQFKNGLVAGVPESTIVAHKFGERRLTDSLQLHDCGIIYDVPSPYLICVMTRGSDFSKMSSIIQKVSQDAFDYFQTTKKK